VIAGFDPGMIGGFDPPLASPVGQASVRIAAGL